MGYGSLVSLVFHNLPSLYPSSFRRNDFSYLYKYDQSLSVMETYTFMMIYGFLFEL